MASTLVESPSELNQLFRDISSKFSPAESEDVVKSSKRIYGEQFKSLGNQDLLSCLDRLCKFGYVSSKKLTLIKEFIATRSNNEQDINKRLEDFEISRPSQPETEKELHGRIGELKEITEKLKMKPFVVNLYGSAGVGKTTLAKNICDKWAGKKYVFDLREAKDMTTVYLNIMGKLDLNIKNVRLDMSTVIGRIHDLLKVTSKDPPVLLLLDNVDLFTEGKKKEGENLKTQFLDFLGKLSEFDGEKGSLTMLLTSRTQLNNSEKVSDFKLQPLTNNFSEKILLPTEAFHVEAQQKKKLLDICKGVPLLLKGTAAILKQRRKSPSDLIDEIEMNSKEEAGVPVKSKYEEDTEERPFNLEEEGIDDEQISVIREMFYTLPSDTLRVSAVSVSLFHGPFTASTAAKILGVGMSEAVAQLEGLVTNEIIHVVDEDAKQLMYDIHPLLRKYAESIKNDAMFYESYTEAKGRFYEHFMSKMKRIAGFIESSYIKAFNEFKRDRPNFEFAIDISLSPEYFSVPGGYHESALIVSLFNAMLSGKKQTKLFHSWAETCKDDGNLGSLFRSQLRCWEARLVSESQGAQKAFEVLEKASTSLKQVDDKSTESFKLTQGLYFYFQGEIYYQSRDYQKAIKCLESSLDLMEGPLKLDTNLARCYNALGNCYYGLGRLEKALEFYNKALKMREELSGSDYHYDMPVYKNQIGTVHEDKGECEEAVKCYKDALELLEELKCLGYEDEALFRRNLANVYVRQEKYKEANEEAEKAYEIRRKRLGNHPETVRSIFQLGLIQANLETHEKALEFFFKAWKMEKLLGAGNQSAVWRKIIKGVFDMYESLKEKGAEIDKEKEEFRQDALASCERFWEEEKACPQFNFTPYNKEIIDAILYLLGEKASKCGMADKKERALMDKYEREALWFYDGMQGITEESFNNEFDGSTDNKVLNELLRERTAFLDKLIELCNRQDQHEKLLKHKEGKITLFTKVLKRPDFVGKNKQKKASLKSAVEHLCQETGEKGSIKRFRENLLTKWQEQWEEGEGAEESKDMMVARERMIQGILQLCKELKTEERLKRYGAEALSFYEKLWEKRHAEMKLSKKKGFLKKMRDLASSIGDSERMKIYLDALEALREETQPVVTLSPKEKKPLFEEPSLEADDEEEEIEVEAEEDIKVVTAHDTSEGESQGVTTEESVQEDEEAEVKKGSSDVTSRKAFVFKGTVTKQGTHWNLEQASINVKFPPDAVPEDRTVTVRRWNSSVCFPPLSDNETLVSGIIELSTDNAQSFEFNQAVTLVVSHCAADLKGYEVVAKTLIDRDSNVWNDIPETVDVRSMTDVKKLQDPALMSVIPEYFLPFAKFKITQCSTFGIICRLKSNEFTITSEGNVVSLPEFPLFSVSVPENAIKRGEQLRFIVKLQEIRQRAFRGKEVCASPILRVTSPDPLQFRKPVTIQLPLTVRGESSDVPDVSSCNVRILFQESASEEGKWTELTLDTPASCDGMVIKFSVKHFSKFVGLLQWGAESMVWLVQKALSSFGRTVGKAAFFAAFVPRDTRVGSSTNLRLYCSPTDKKAKIYNDEKILNHVRLRDKSSSEMMCLGDKAYVFLSGDSVRLEENELDEEFLCFHDDDYWTDLKVFVIDHGDLTVEFCSSREQDQRRTLCKMKITLPPPESKLEKNTGYEASSSFAKGLLRVTLLGDEWGSSKGGLSTLNRELAKHLARQPDVQVTVLLPHYSEREKQEANVCKVSLATPEPMTGFDSISGLSFTREDHAIDVIIGHGQKLGAPAQAIAKQQKCRRVHIIHTASEELAMFKKSDKAIPEGEEKHETEMALCKEADIVVAIGPKLTEAFSAYLQPHSKDQHVMNITPGICPEFVKLKRQVINEGKKFRVLLFGRGDLEDFQLKGYDIAAEAVAGLKEKSYLLIFVGAPEGKEGEIKVEFEKCGISPSQLIVRGFVESRKKLGHLFREVDLAIIPSRTEGFGLTALEALSAGLPFLVSGNSGFGQAIHALALGRKFVVDSDLAEDWGKAIRRVRQTPRENRLEEALSLRKLYDQKYKWEKQCEKLVKKMWASFLFHSGSEHCKVNKVLRRSLSV